MDFAPDFSAPTWVRDYIPSGSNQLYVVVTEPNASVANLTLVRGRWGQITGRVVNGSNTPLQRVQAQAIGQQGVAGYATTDANGVYTIQHLKSGKYTMRFYPQSSGTTSNYAALLLNSSVGVNAPYTTTNVNATLSYGGRIVGSVVAADTGQPPLGRQWIYFEGIGHAFSTSTETSNGQYSIHGLPPGQYRVSADTTTGRYARTYHGRTTSAAAATPVQVTALMTTTNVNISLIKGG